VRRSTTDLSPPADGTAEAGAGGDGTTLGRLPVIHRAPRARGVQAISARRRSRHRRAATHNLVTGRAQRGHHHIPPHERGRPMADNDTAAERQRWDHEAHHVEPDLSTLREFLREISEQGWELVQIHGDIAIIRRPHEPSVTQLRW
jgi:hypothetical protein